jgi:hypothetical protein
MLVYLELQQQLAGQLGRQKALHQLALRHRKQRIRLL